MGTGITLGRARMRKTLHAIKTIGSLLIPPRKQGEQIMGKSCGVPEISLTAGNIGN